MRQPVLTILGLTLPLVSAAQTPQLLWGDTHLHTTYSSDAYANNNLSAGPDVAYRYARGEPVVHPYHGARVQIGRPLDFLVVSDHAEFLGQIRAVHRDGISTDGMGLFEGLRARFAAWYLGREIDKGEGRKLFVSVLPDPGLTPEEDAEASSVQESDVQMLPMPLQVEIDTWRLLTDTADQFNDPGKFTALIGWEWSAIPGGANLHRVVITDSDAATAQQYDPIGLDQSPYPEDLWQWLDETSAATGAGFVAIPHNSNISKGYMFAGQSLRGERIDADYARQRARWEPVAEITQIKGDSETHSKFSPADEFADFENYPFYIQRRWTEYQPQPGDFVRQGLKLGLAIEQEIGVNPYRLGVIGSTDAHTSLSSAEERNFHGKMPTDSIPDNKQITWGDDGPSTNGWSMSASGMAAVWARENTRAGILEALKERRVYGTSGPRIGVQFFGGHGLNPAMLESADLYEAAGAAGVAMGGELGHAESSPGFLVLASRDPDTANLDRIQMVKGWVTPEGVQREQVYNLAWSGERQLDARGNLPAVGNTVNLETGQVENTIGEAQLAAFWQDPDFNPAERAFYYVRVLQIPTARHSFLDALALGREHAEGHPDTIQERAYTSPIWYRPEL